MGHRPQFDSWVGKIHWRRDRLPTPVFLGFPCGSADKESACNVGNLGSIPGLGRCSGERKGYPLQYSGLENSMDYIVHEVRKSWTWLSNFHFQKERGLPWWLSVRESTCQCRRHGFDPWVGKIPWRRKWQPTLVFLPGKYHEQRKPGGLQSMELKKSWTWLSD